MIGLRAIGAMTFVHVEINTTNIGDKVWEGKLCRFNPNSRSYRIYNHEIGTVVETRNNSFIETPPGVHRTQEDDSHGDEVTEGVYTNDAMDYTAVLGPFMLGSFRGASRDDVEKLP